MQNNYCDKCGNCSRCGNCCAATIPITKKEEERIRAYIDKNKIEAEFFQKGNYMNLNCCFYDRDKKICKIYEVRPSICKSYKCNRKEEELNIEREINHKKAYWNKLENDKTKHLTDMRLLFYGDPRSLVANILYRLTNGTMEVTEKHVELMKKILKDCGQSELANSIKGESVC